DPRPHLTTADTEPGEGGDGKARRCNESGDCDVQMADVVVEGVVERLDLVLAACDLVGPDAELEEVAGEVADEEDGCVSDECDGREGHEIDAPLQRRRLLAV